MKILFLDIDGVVNCEHTRQRHRGFTGIDPHLAFIVGKITLAIPELKVVLSSSWRMFEDGGIDEIESQVVPLYGQTPRLEGEIRGKEIQAWLDQHPEVERYAILDDDNDMLPVQMPNFFQTAWHTGITEEVAKRVIEHLQGSHN